MYDETIFGNELAFPSGIYQYVHTMCYIHPIHIILGFYYEMYLCGVMGFALFFTSFNYWRNPVIPSIRRNVDMFAAFTIVPYHYYLSLYTSNKLLCTGMGTTGIILYPVSLFLQHNYNYIKAAAFCHSLMHMCVSLSACFIYQDYYEQGLSLEWNILPHSHPLNTDNTT
jgi:hypothetical protein